MSKKVNKILLEKFTSTFHKTGKNIVLLKTVQKKMTIIELYLNLKTQHTCERVLQGLVITTTLHLIFLLIIFKIRSTNYDEREKLQKLSILKQLSYKSKNVLGSVVSGGDLKSALHNIISKAIFLKNIISQTYLQQTVES